MDNEHLEFRVERLRWGEKAEHHHHCKHIFYPSFEREDDARKRKLCRSRSFSFSLLKGERGNVILMCLYVSEFVCLVERTLCLVEWMSEMQQTHTTSSLSTSLHLSSQCFCCYCAIFLRFNIFSPSFRKSIPDFGRIKMTSPLSGVSFTQRNQTFL